MNKLGGKVHQTPLKKLKKQADDIFSLYIRTRDNFTCYTCGKEGNKTNIDCGHFISRAKLGTRYDEINCHAQCKGCNIMRKGNLTAYALRLEKDFGQGILQELDKRATEGLINDSRALYIEVISKYTVELEKLQRKNKLQIIHVGELTVINPFGTVKEEVNAETR